MAMPELQDFCLVGGTALSLLHGHRISIDLDLFSNKTLDNPVVIEALTKKFGDRFISEEKQARFGIFCFLNDIKVDIISHPHPLIRPPVIIEGIRMFSVEDIMAMKVQAILGRGRKKDFWDIAALLQHYSVEDFIRFHKEKYSTQHLFITVPQALIYFADAEEGEAPISLKGQTWESVQAFIREKVRLYLQ
jgi:hypothetical protein